MKNWKLMSHDTNFWQFSSFKDVTISSTAHTTESVSCRTPINCANFFNEKNEQPTTHCTTTFTAVQYSSVISREIEELETTLHSLWDILQ